MRPHEHRVMVIFLSINISALIKTNETFYDGQQTPENEDEGQRDIHGLHRVHTPPG